MRPIVTESVKESVDRDRSRSWLSEIATFDNEPVAQKPRVARTNRFPAGTGMLTRDSHPGERRSGTMSRNA